MKKDSPQIESTTRSKTSEEMRAEEINQALVPAYRNASKLKISKDECKQLMKSFPDEAFEIRPNDGIVFIPHIFLSERLNEVFTPGSWSLICRRHWHDTDTQSIYGEHVLIIRGCFVGEAIGEFHFNQTTQRFGDALEATAAEALRRVCGKRLGVGNEIWKPQFILQWKEKYATISGKGRDQVWTKKGSVQTLDSEVVIQSSGREQKRHAKQHSNDEGNEDSRHIMLQILCAECGNGNVLNYALAKDLIKSGEKIDDWPLDKIAVTESEVKHLVRQVKDFIAATKPDIKWEEVEIPFGSRKGKKLGELDRKTIHEFWKDFTKESVSEGVFKTYSSFRQSLDKAGEHFGFKK